MCQMICGAFPVQSLRENSEYLPLLGAAQQNDDLVKFFVIHVLPLIPFDGSAQSISDLRTLLVETAPHLTRKLSCENLPFSSSSFMEKLDEVLAALQRNPMQFSHLITLVDDSACENTLGAKRDCGVRSSASPSWRRSLPIYRPDDLRCNRSITMFAEQLVHHAIVPRLLILDGLGIYHVSLSAVSSACNDQPLLLHHVIEAAQRCPEALEVSSKAVSLAVLSNPAGLLLRYLHREIRRVTQMIAHQQQQQKASDSNRIDLANLLSAAVSTGAVPQMPLHILRLLIRTCPQQWIMMGDKSCQFREVRIKGPQLVRLVQPPAVKTTHTNDAKLSPIEIAQLVVSALTAQNAPPKGFELSRLATMIGWPRYSHIRVKTFRRFLSLFPQHFATTNERCSLASPTASSIPLAMPPELRVEDITPSTIDQRPQSVSAAELEVGGAQLSIGDIDIIVRIVSALRTSSAPDSLIGGGDGVSLSALCEQQSLRDHRVVKIVRLLPATEIELNQRHGGDEVSLVSLGSRHKTGLLDQVVAAKRVDEGLRQDVFDLLIKPRLAMQFSVLPISQLEKWVDWNSAVKARLGSLDEFIEDGLSQEVRSTSQRRKVGMWNGCRAVLLVADETELVPALHEQAIAAKLFSSDDLPVPLLRGDEAPPPPLVQLPKQAVSASPLPTPPKLAMPSSVVSVSFAAKISVVQSLRNSLILLRLAAFVVQVIFEQLMPLFFQSRSLGGMQLVSRPDEWLREKTTWTKRHMADLGGDVMSLIRFFDGVFFEVSPALDSLQMDGGSLADEGLGQETTGVSSPCYGNGSGSSIVALFRAPVTPRLVFSRVISHFLIPGVPVALHDLERALAWSQHFHSRCGPLRNVLESCSSCCLSPDREPTVTLRPVPNSRYELTHAHQLVIDSVVQELHQRCLGRSLEERRCAPFSLEVADIVRSQLFPLQFSLRCEPPRRASENLLRLASEFVAVYVVPLLMEHKGSSAGIKSGMTCEKIRERLDWYATVQVHPMLLPFLVSRAPSAPLATGADSGPTVDTLPALESFLFHAADAGIISVGLSNANQWTLPVSPMVGLHHHANGDGSLSALLRHMPTSPVSVVELYMRWAEDDEVASEVNPDSDEEHARCLFPQFLRRLADKQAQKNRFGGASADECAGNFCVFPIRDSSPSSLSDVLVWRT